MSFSGFSFIFWRVFEIITLIPIVGMLAWFINWYNERYLLTPRSILILFIVATLALAWALGTLFLYTRARHSAAFVAFVDFLFFGAFIGAVYELRGIAKANCSQWDSNGTYSTDLGLFTISGDTYALNIDKQCAMLKASFAFGIMNVIFFFTTAFWAHFVSHHYGNEVVVKRDVHRSRHGSHRSRSPRHSHHSHHRHSRSNYV